MEDSPMPPTIDNLASDLQTLTLESKEKEKDTEDTQEQLKLPDDVLVVDTEQTFQIAVSELKEYAIWAVDCEGFNLGIEGGALSILSCRGIPGSPAKTPVSLPKTFLFDIVVLTHPETGFSIQPLLELLASSSTRKVFWDGRMDFCAIYFGLGTALSNVVDLQVVEMRRRISEENVQKQFQRLMRFFNPRHFQDPRRSKKYIHIHLLQGLGGCLLENKVGTKASKGSVDHDSWMIRPLSDAHLFYAANDVYLMEVLFLNFEERGLIDDVIVLQSLRYVRMWEDQQPIDGDLFRSNPFFALETLEYNDNSSKKTCGGCGRNLSQNSFPAGSWDRQQENRFCHICDLIPTWQRREQFFADLKMKKKEEQEKKRAEAERSKKGKGKERAEGETLEQTKTVVDEKPKEGDDLKSGPSGSTPQDKGVSRSSGGRRRPVPNTAGRGDPSGKRPTPTQQPRIATVSNTTEKGGEVAEDGRKGITRNLRGNTARGNPPNATRAVPTVRTTTNHSEHGAVGTQDGTRRDHRGVRGGTGYVRGQGRRAGGTARGSKTTSQAPEQHVPSGSLTTETPTSHPQRKSAWARGPPSRTGRGGRGGESGDRGSA